MIAHETIYRSWMLAALAGDGGAYRQLLTALTSHLRAYFARRLDAAAAEDAVQETLIALHAKRATYDPAIPFTAWVHGIARYKLMDEYRRRKRQTAVPLDETSELFATEDTEAMLARHDVLRLLDRLPESKRAMVAAWKVNGDSLAEIAVRSGMSESAVKVTIHRALKFLSSDLDLADAHR